MQRVLKPDKKISLEIKPMAPFNFDGTFYVPQCFPTPDFEWKPGVYWRTLNFKGKIFGFKIENKGTKNRPKIRLTIFSKKELKKNEISDILTELNWRCGFFEDISEFCEKFKSDKFLKPALKNWGGMRLKCANSLYELLIIAIVLQNTVVRRSVQMMNNLFEKFGTLLHFDTKKLYAYWNPEDLNEIGEEDLRKLKVGYRAKMIKRISKSFSRGEVDEFELRKIPLDEAKEKLLKLYGVGPATSQVIMAGYLRNYETFELRGRLWEQKLISRILFNKKLVSAEKILNELEKRYGEWKCLAFHYLLQHLFWQHKKKKIPWLEKEIRL